MSAAAVKPATYTMHWSCARCLSKWTETHPLRALHPENPARESRVETHAALDVCQRCIGKTYPEIARIRERNKLKMEK